MKSSAPWILSFSLFVNFTLAAVLYISKSDYFMKIVAASEGFEESQREFLIWSPSALVSIENIASRMDFSFKKIELSIENIRADIEHIEEVITF